jgi:methyltransferase
MTSSEFILGIVTLQRAG